MKKFLHLPLVTLLALGFGFTACNKDDSDGFKLQAHDENTFMRIMHDMSEDMDMMQPTMDPDNDYAMMMIMHHTGAIKMGQQELKDGDDPTIRAIAQRMISAQQAEIEQFKAFLATHPAHAPMVMEFHERAMMAMATMDRNNDLRPLTGDADRDFAQLMIDHHTSAIEMSEDILELGRDTQTKVLARQIIEDQEMEIKELQEWLLRK